MTGSPVSGRDVEDIGGDVEDTRFATEDMAPRATARR